MRKGLFSIVIIFFVLLFASSASGIEKTERITQREIIERLTRLEEGQRAIMQRFDDFNKRFDDLNKQIDRLTAVFTALVIAVIGFAYWDRRTIIKKAKEEAISEIEKEGRLKDLLKALRELARTNQEVEKVLKEHNLL